MSHQTPPVSLAKVDEPIRTARALILAADRLNRPLAAPWPDSALWNWKPRPRKGGES
jgi:hypothetical protein